MLPNFLTPYPESPNSNPNLHLNPNLNETAAQFFVGPRGSGAPWHFHSDAFNALAHGGKRWFMTPPGSDENEYSTKHPMIWLQEREKNGEQVPRALR